MTRFATKTVSVLAGLGVLALLAVPAADGGGYGGGYGSMMMGGEYWLGMGLHGLFWILVLTAIVIAIVWAVRSAGRPFDQGAHAAPGARELLDTRYANGEIEHEDYLARKKDLEG